MKLCTPEEKIEYLEGALGKDNPDVKIMRRFLNNRTPKRPVMSNFPNLKDREKKVRLECKSLGWEVVDEPSEASKEIHEKAITHFNDTLNNRKKGKIPTINVVSRIHTGKD